MVDKICKNCEFNNYDFAPHCRDCGEEHKYFLEKQNENHKDESAKEIIDSKFAEEYAYKTLAEFEELLGARVNEAFRIGWMMGRIKKGQLQQLIEVNCSSKE